MEARANFDTYLNQNTTRSSLYRNESHLLSLSRWQRLQLSGMHPSGIQCMIDSWIFLAKNPIKEPHCSAFWDEIYCWPPTLAGTTVRRACSEVMKDDKEVDAQNVIGDAFRICSSNATWLWDNWTNYNECMSGLDDLKKEEGHRQINDFTEDNIREAVRYILFVGSISSLICLCVALFSFYYFKLFRFDRVIIQVHLILSLVLRYILLTVISEPFIFIRSSYTYRSMDWVCKVVLASQFYAMVASVNWMFVQGHYLHTRLTTYVSEYRVPFRLYFLFGWGLPLILVSVWSFLIELYHPYPCWSNYGDLSLNWIIVGPMLSVLLINFIFLLNIVRILLWKIKPVRTSVTDAQQFLQAVKATIALFPLLGFNFLIFCYNPGGTAELYYILANSICQTFQGIFVSIYYCLYSKKVRNAYRRLFCRLLACRHGRSSRRIITRQQLLPTMRAKKLPMTTPEALSGAVDSKVMRTINQNTVLKVDAKPIAIENEREGMVSERNAFLMKSRVNYWTRSDVTVDNNFWKEKASRGAFSDIL